MLSGGGGSLEMVFCVSRVRAWESDPVPDARAADGELRWYLLMAHIWTCVPICNIIPGASVVEDAYLEARALCVERGSRLRTLHPPKYI